MLELEKDIDARMEDIEQTISILTAQVTHHKLAFQEHIVLLHQLLSQQDDAENRNRRNNIRIQSLPKTVEPQDLQSVAIS